MAFHFSNHHFHLCSVNPLFYPLTIYSKTFVSHSMIKIQSVLDKTPVSQLIQSYNASLPHQINSWLEWRSFCPSVLTFLDSLAFNMADNALLLETISSLDFLDAAFSWVCPSPLTVSTQFPLLDPLLLLLSQRWSATGLCLQFPSLFFTLIDAFKVISPWHKVKCH